MEATLLKDQQQTIQPQAVAYADESQLQVVLSDLSSRQPLVNIQSIQALQLKLSEVAAQKSFLLQLGDCAEAFADCELESVSRDVGLMQKLADMIENTMRMPVTLVGRIAGQYAKPRTRTQEIVGDIALPMYRGDMINDCACTAEARQYDPTRLLKAYDYSRQTLNFLETIGETYSRPLFVSHEALHMSYEQSLTKLIETKSYNLSTQFPWVGMRTALINSPQIKFASAIENPIAIKISVGMTADNLQQLIKKLNPQKIPGRLTLITRLGSGRVQECLPKLIRAQQSTGIPVLWMVDPMHGNTYLTEDGIKTRHCDDLLKEILLTREVHEQCSSQLNGLHLETTADDVMECLGGDCDYTEKDLAENYRSLLDPRLNATQAEWLVASCI